MEKLRWELWEWEKRRNEKLLDSAEAEVKRAMAKNSSAIIVVATADKLSTAAPFRVASPDAIRHLVVDGKVKTSTLAQFKKHGTEVHRA